MTERFCKNIINSHTVVPGRYKNSEHTTRQHDKSYKSGPAGREAGREAGRQGELDKYADTKKKKTKLDTE